MTNHNSFFDVLAKKYMFSPENDNDFSLKVLSTEFIAKTLHFLPRRSKIALVPPIFELDL